MPEHHQVTIIDKIGHRTCFLTPDKGIIIFIRINLYVRRALLVWQDFVAPFFRFIRSEYTLNYKSIDSHVSPSLVELESLATNYFAGRITRKTKIVMAINEKGICSLDVRSGNLNIWAECTD
ncbi:MAG: hypothetical protein E4G95_01435 [Bacteroidia bacterium]|nr:MAG: hypothetical protein E4G95_01435 [Bacteroidia bacterium]